MDKNYEEIRAAHVAEAKDAARRLAPNMEEMVDQLREELLLNRDHIAGIAIVVVAAHGTALVGCKGGVGDTQRVSCSIDKSYDAVLAAELRAMIPRIENMYDKPANPLAGLLASLKGAK